MKPSALNVAAAPILRVAACLLLVTSLGATTGCLALAAEAAFAEDFGWNVTESRSSATELRVVARTVQDDRVRVEGELQGQNLTEIEIRVGTMGDEALSRRVLDAIRARL